MIEDGNTVSGSLNDFNTLKEYNLLNELKIKSLALVPIMGDNNTTIGFVGFDNILYQQQWTSLELNTLSTIASILGTIYSKKQEEEKESEIFKQGVTQIRSYKKELDTYVKNTLKLIEELK
jgi:GAF domain-containing protein